MNLSTFFKTMDKEFFPTIIPTRKKVNFFFKVRKKEKSYLNSDVMFLNFNKHIISASASENDSLRRRSLDLELLDIENLPVVDELIGERIARLALHDIGLGSLVSQRDSRNLMSEQDIGD